MNEYVTAAQLKTSDQVTGTYADTEYTNAAAAASRAIEEACGSEEQPRKFWADPSPVDRYYTAPVRYGAYAGAYSNVLFLDVDDIAPSVGGTVVGCTVTVDLDGDGVYETTWTQGTEYYLDPVNAVADDRPFERICLRSLSGAVFPAWPNAVKVTAHFGWPSVPPQVTQYAYIFAAQLLMRTRQTPFGIQMAGIEIGSSARISRHDPDFDRLLGKFVRPARLIA